MYTPEIFQAGCAATLTFLEHHSFGQLVSFAGGEFCNTFVPFMLDDDGGVARAHIAKANPQWQTLHGATAMLSVLGPHHDISPSIYESPGVPTWNTMAANLHGSVQVRHDQEFLHALLHDLTEKYKRLNPTPWQPQFNPAMLTAIVGMELNITRIEGKFKLSQNRSLENRRHTQAWLASLGEHELAEAMLSASRSQDHRTK